ncbi:SIR2 family protein [Flavobacterium sp.]|uniref:SIR2 family protein n=1 Tax=Flavobacterium sp. TaxID=239 RepID=UPI003A8EF874
MRIDYKESFIDALNKNINLFIGAGFSYGAFNKEGLRLPLGEQLCNELVDYFKVPKLDLPKVAALIERKDSIGLKEFLKNRFNVGSFEGNYNILHKIPIKNVFTTNIDNFIDIIFENCHDKYINDATINGPSFNDKKSIDFYPLHGNISNDEKPMVFSPTAISTSFSSNIRVWEHLKSDLEKYPTLFWGYSLNDSGVLQALDSVKINGHDNSEKWIVLHKENPDEEEYFKTLGFNIIISDNNSLLAFIKENYRGEQNKSKSKLKTSYDRFGIDFIPPNISKIPLREITEFYLGSAPRWSDVYAPNLYKTKYFKQIKNNIFSNKNNIVLGIPGSGKTTLLMQLAAFIDFEGYKIILDHPTIEKANIILNCLEDEPAIVFIDNFTDEVRSFELFHNKKNIKLVAFDREHNFEIISHLINRNEFNITSVTSLSREECQEIYNRIPEGIKLRNFTYDHDKREESPSLFEFLNKNLKVPSVNERYKDLLTKLEDDEVLLDFLVLASYVHYCRTPLSFDMVYSFFGDDIENYAEIFKLRDTLGELLTNLPIDLIDNDDQDYFATRSNVLSEVIIDNVKSNVLKRVLTDFVSNLPPYKIVQYKTFRKKGYDKFFVIRAFTNWIEGKDYYEKLIVDDPRNPFLYQQGALYLSHKQRHTEAFYWIEKAKSLSKDKVLSIRNSHAIILFESNIKKEGANVKDSLDSSMDILKNCYYEDKRKLYHAKKFAEQSIAYYNRYGDTKAKEYINEAEAWIREEIRQNKWNTQLKHLHNKLRELIRWN